jgi:hypothetical protein
MWQSAASPGKVLLVPTCLKGVHCGDAYMKRLGITFLFVSTISLVLCAQGRAATLSCGQTIKGSITAAAQTDSYTFSASVGDAVIVSAYGISGTLFTVAEVYNPSGTLISTSAINGRTNVIAIATSGTHTILLHDSANFRTGDYGINLQFTNGKCSMSISCGETKTGTVNLASQQTAYTFSAAAGDRIIISAYGYSGTIFAVAEIYNPSGTLMSTSAINGRTNVLPIATSGTYTILLRDSANFRTGDYGINLQFTNGKCSTAISCGETKNGTIDFASQQTAYTFSAAAGDRVIVSTYGYSGTLFTVAETYDPSGSLLATTPINGKTNAIAIAASGTYTILLRDSANFRTGSYGINLQFTNGKCGASISCGETKSGTISIASQQNAYAFSASAGNTVIVSSTGTSGTIFTVAELYDPAGLLIATTPVNGKTNVVSLLTSGTHTILVHDSALFRTGNYSLNLQSTIGSCGSGPVIPNNPVPSISLLSPGGILVGSSTFDIVVSGSNFVSASKVQWNGQDRYTTFLGSGQLRASIPASDVATANNVGVMVSNPSPGGGASNALAFSVNNPAPSIVCLNPISVVAGSTAFTLIVHGSGFVAASTVQWNGANRTTTYISGTELRAAISTGDISNAGAGSITVTNPSPGGGASGVKALPIETLGPGAPTITSLDPDSLSAGGGDAVITVNGTGFVPSSVVQFNGASRATTFVSDTKLTVVILAADIAIGLTNAIAVVNPTANVMYMTAASGGSQGEKSNVGVVTVLNPVPVLSGMTPSSAKARGSGFSMAADGEKFVSTSKVLWNGVERATTYTSKTRLGGAVPDADLAMEGTGTASVMVSSPGPGGGISNSLSFTIRTNKASTSTIYFPRLVSTGKESTGIAVANMSGTDAVLTLWAYDKTGQEVKGRDIVNPVSVSIAGVEQLPIVDWQLYGTGLPEKTPTGWVKAESTVSKVVGFFLTFNDTLSILDGADVSGSVLNTFMLPEIEDQGFTQIHVVSPDEAGEVRLQLYGSDGNAKGAAAVRKVEKNGAVAESFNELFPGVPANASDYIRGTSTTGVVTFEYLGKTEQYVEGLNGQDGNTGATILYSPQYVVGGGFRTTLSIVNVEGVSGTVTLELFGDDGKGIGTPKTVAIAANGKVHISDQSFLADPTAGLVQGYVRITSSGPKLVGSVVFGDPERKQFSSSLPLVSRLASAFVFGQVASNDVYYTGIAMLNPNDTAASMTIDVYNRNGERIATKMEDLPSKGRVSKLLIQYFPELKDQNISSGYIKVTSDKGVASFALFGTHSSSVLSAIPAQVIP